RGQSDTLQAAPNEMEREIQREMDRLDALIQKGVLEPRDSRSSWGDARSRSSDARSSSGAPRSGSGAARSGESRVK
ncbi:MAG: hypothetical protein ABIP94_05345, partial [Planctomycetota bacterium]